jgi:hypothetical protein
MRYYKEILAAYLRLAIGEIHRNLLRIENMIIFT